MEQSLTYESAYNELQEITAELESDNVSVDMLAEKTKRAATLIKYCQDKLRATEADVADIIQSMDSDRDSES